MGIKPPYPSRTAGQACWEISRYGMILPEPEFVAGQRALQERENQKAKKVEKPEENQC